MDGPCQEIDFLGILIITKMCNLALQESTFKDLQQLVEDYSIGKWSSKRQLKKSNWKLSWASMVVEGGRTFFRRIIELIKCTQRN